MKKKKGVLYRNKMSTIMDIQINMCVYQQDGCYELAVLRTLYISCHVMSYHICPSFNKLTFWVIFLFLFLRQSCWLVS